MTFETVMWLVGGLVVGGAAGYVAGITMNLVDQFALLDEDTFAETGNDRSDRAVADELDGRIQRIIAKDTGRHTSGTLRHIFKIARGEA